MGLQWRDGGNSEKERKRERERMREAGDLLCGSE